MLLMLGSAGFKSIISLPLNRLPKLKHVGKGPDGMLYENSFIRCIVDADSESPHMS